MITYESHPHLHAVIAEMEEANNVGSKPAYTAGTFEALLPQMEEACATLTDEEIQIFTDGEQTESEAIAARSVPLMAVYHLLNLIFNS
jgi:hypothetical protein